MVLPRALIFSVSCVLGISTSYADEFVGMPNCLPCPQTCQPVIPQGGCCVELWRPFPGGYEILVPDRVVGGPWPGFFEAVPLISEPTQCMTHTSDDLSSIRIQIKKLRDRDLEIEKSIEKLEKELEDLNRTTPETTSKAQPPFALLDRPVIRLR